MSSIQPFQCRFTITLAFCASNLFSSCVWSCFAVAGRWCVATCCRFSHIIIPLPLPQARSYLLPRTFLVRHVAAPIAAALLLMDGLWGLRGWQILFFVEVRPPWWLGCLTGRTLIGGFDWSQAGCDRSKPRVGCCRQSQSQPKACIGNDLAILVKVDVAWATTTLLPSTPLPIQGLPSVVLGLLIWHAVPRHIHDARFLTSSERLWLASMSAGARKHAEQAEALGSRRMLMEALGNSRLWVIMAVGMMKNAALNG